MKKDSDRLAWEAAAQRLASRVNFGWWVERWLPWALGLCLSAAAALLVLRSLGTVSVLWAWAVLGAALLLAVLLCWWAVRRRFESAQTATVRLEDALGLHAQLSAAKDGIAPWPSFPLAGVPLPVTWKWQRPVQTLLLATTLLALATLVPVPQAKAARARVIEKPAAVREVESWLEQLKQEEVVEDSSLEEVEQKIEELLRRPSDQWYEHASLEAAENLRDETGRELQELGSALEQMRGSVTTLAELGEKLSETAQKGMTKQFQENLQGMRSGGMVAGGDLMKQLKDIDPTSFSQLSQQQKDNLKQKLKDNANALREALKNSPKFDFSECPCKNPGEGQPQPGQGEIQRGRNDAALTLKNQPTNLGTKRTETVSQPLDLDRLAPGDMVGLADGKHDVKEDAKLGAAGGALQGTGSGGSAVWRENLVPAEREVLRRYFK